MLSGTRSCVRVGGSVTSSGEGAVRSGQVAKESEVRECVREAVEGERERERERARTRTRWWFER